VASFIAFALGILIAIHAPPVRPVLWFGLACIGAALAQASRSKHASYAMALTLGLLGAGIASSHLGPWPDDSLAHALPGPDEPQMLIEVEGLITSRVERSVPRAGALTPFVPRHMELGERYRFELNVRRIRAGEGWQDASGVLTVWLDANTQPTAVRAGRTVRITGNASRSSGPENPGQIDWALANRDTGRVGWLATGPDLVVQVSPRNFRERVERALLGLRGTIQSRAATIIDRATQHDPHAGPVVRGLILGESGADDLGVRSAFQRVGMLHLLAVSGFHVAVAAAIALLAIRVTGDRGWIEPMVVCLALGLYVMIVPMRAPIFRAAVLVLAVLAGDALGRRHDRLSVVCWVAIVWLALRPSDLLSLGFQLSFGLTAWLMLLAEPRRDAAPMLGEPTRFEMTRAFLLAPVRAAAACWSLATPTILYHTGVFSTLAVVATLVTVPMIIGSMWLGFLVLIVGSLVPAFMPMASGLLRLFSGAAARTALTVDAIPLASLHLSGVSLAWTVCATLGVIWLWRCAKLRDWKWVALLLALVVWLGVEVRAERHAQHRGTSIHMLAVGDASAMLIRSGASAALWDVGSWRQNIGRSVIPSACRSLASPRVETVFITHANIDHYMGVVDVLGPLGVQRVVTGESFANAAMHDPQGAPAFVLGELERLGIEHRVAVADDVFELDGAQLRILHPPAGFAPRAENDASLVAMLEPKDASARALLTGDIQREAMALLLESDEDLRADVIELPHHGSAHEAAYDFVQHVNPSVVLQSTGRKRVDDPRWDTTRAGRTWLVTQRHGMCTARLLPDGKVHAEAFR
jgi:competence protein ComEC